MHAPPGNQCDDDEVYCERLARVTIGPPTRAPGGRIELREPDPAWPLRYDALAERLRRALGAEIHRLEHVGSTSVPGLVAKPIVDVVLEVADSAREDAYVPALERLGYRLRIREPAWFEHRLLRPETGDVNLHVFSAGCPETARMVRFRDHLRECEEDRDRYAAAKRALAARRWTYVQQYADAKSEIIAALAGTAGA